MLQPPTPQTTAPAGEESLDQKDFLAQVKKTLSSRGKRMTWDDMARLVGVEPRAMKTYRMPVESADYRAMPRPVRNAIEALVKNPGAVMGANAPVAVAEPPKRSAVFGGVPAALAAMVVRQAQNVMLDGRGTMVSGIDRRWGMGVGLDVEDRKAMALVSRARLSLGLSDLGAEIHELLSHCVKPLGDWLPLPEIEEQGLQHVRLIDPVEALPTMEAEELSADFSGMASLFEEQVFSVFVEILAKLPKAEADRLYTRVREFAVRHPVVTQSGVTKICRRHCGCASNTASTSRCHSRCCRSAPCTSARTAAT